MASSSIGTILGLGIAGVAGYFLWNKFGQSAPAAAPPPATSGGGVIPSSTPPPAGSGVSYSQPSLAQQLASAAQGNAFLVGGKMNADQWEYILTNPPLSRSPVDPGKFNSAFFPSGRPADPASNPTMTPDQFVAALGLSGMFGLGALPGPNAGGNYHRAPITHFWDRRWQKRNPLTLTQDQIAQLHPLIAALRAHTITPAQMTQLRSLIAPLYPRAGVLPPPRGPLPPVMVS